MEYIVQVNEVTKKYGKYVALDNFCMNVPKGAIYGFVGKNGAGKTTLIRIITGVQEPSKGNYSLYGVKNSDKKISKVRSKIGAVVETPSIYLDKTAKENLKQQCLILGMNNYDIIPEILKLVGLDNTGRKKARNFSFGMRQRLGIAIALIGNPEFIVLDEPINGLDPQGIMEIRELITKLNKEKNITVLISSHILDELSKLATHYGFIDNGKMIKEISAKELENRHGKCKLLEVSDVNLAKNVFDKHNVNHEILENNNLKVYDDMTVTELVLTLKENNCDVIRLTEYEDSLESYFVNLVGGTKDE